MAKSKIGVRINGSEIEVATGNSVYYAKLPANLVDAEGVLSPELLSQFIKEFKNINKITGKDCTVILPENATFFRAVESPVLADEQIKLNLPFEFKDYVGDDSINFNYDYIVESVENDENGDPKTLHLLAAAGKKDVMRNYKKFLERADLKFKVALPAEMAIVNLMSKVADENKEYCLIGLGYEFTTVYIMQGSKLRASKTIEYGMTNIDDAICRVMDVDKYLAASYRDENHENVLDNKRVREVYDQIALEVMKTINFYRYEFSDSQLDKAYFFADGSEINALSDTICEQIGFNKGDINELLPKNYRDDYESARCLLSIGAIL